ncbi:hypothetical protein GOBAR_AA02350 [Gossypium barbadense]|uniref:Uncharacterized protein n=1 Tax=Gossypium barbadense TaxID=3634 RepID=A0A2P5YRJ4_GOSBA|nr:hypothetical protein GOBAR_AA02350 [Gossypium barbadense]
MLSKFISVSETRFQNTETALKNQQASIQWLKTQIGQLSKLISERPQGSLPSNTEPNPREQLNAINIQDDEGVVEPEPESRQETVVSKGQGELTLRMGDETITLQARNSGNTLEIEDRRLQIDELDEWQTYKLRTPNKPNLRQNELNTFPNQLKVGDRVLLDVADPHIVATTPNEEIPLMVLSIFPFGTVEVNHPKFGTFKIDTVLGLYTWAWEKRTMPDTAVRHGLVHPYAQGTLAWTKCQTRPNSKFAIQHQTKWHRKGSSPLAPMLIGWLKTLGSSAPQPKNHP